MVEGVLDDEGSSAVEGGEVGCELVVLEAGVGQVHCSIRLL